VKSKLFITSLVLGASLCTAGTLSPSPSDVYARSIQQLGGKLADLSAYPATVAGFAEYLMASGVKAVSADELTRPNHADVAARLGFQAFLPPKAWWPRGAALALLTQSMETATHAAARVRNWWRPAAYNLDPAVGGAKNGDHPTANAFDLDYASALDRMKAESFFRGVQKRFPWMQLSFGLGAQTTHIGLASPKGHREWHYAGWRPGAFASGD
jgi:hypothetical protein